jgi:hypothetical protein
MIHAQDIPVSNEQQLVNLAEWLEMEIEDDHTYNIVLFNETSSCPAKGKCRGTKTTTMVTDLQIQQFINYREHMGPFISIYELQAIPAWDLVTIRKPFPLLQLKIVLW